VKKGDAIKMGTHLDMLNRHANIRVDNHARRMTVENARRLVFEQGIPLSSKHIKNILDKTSGVPTRVSTVITGVRERELNWALNYKYMHTHLV
jgi:hypothetical protein